jgi:hypothetical protein
VFWLLASAVVCCATLFAKETAILLPAVIFVLTLCRPRVDPAPMVRTKNNDADFGIRVALALREIAPFTFVTILFLLMRFHALGGRLSSQAQHLPWRIVLLSWPATLWFYVKVLLWPIHSHAFADPDLAVEFSLCGVFLPCLGVACAGAALMGALVWTWRRASRDLPAEDAIGVKYALLLGSLLLVLPILLTLDLNALSPENFLHGRYTYLPLSGLMLLVAAGFRMTRKYRVLALCAAGLLSVALATLTVLQEQQWRDDLTVLTVAHQLAPRNAPVARALADARVHSALQLDADGRYDEALPILERVTEEYPQDWYAWAALADCYYHLDNLTESEKSLARAAQLSHKPEVLEQWRELKQQLGLPSLVPPE